MSTLIIEFGWFGLGRIQTGLFPAVCAGPMRVTWVRGTLSEALKRAVGK